MHYEPILWILTVMCSQGRTLVIYKRRSIFFYLGPNKDTMYHHQKRFTVYSVLNRCYAIIDLRGAENYTKSKININVLSMWPGPLFK